MHFNLQKIDANSCLKNILEMYLLISKPFNYLAFCPKPTLFGIYNVYFLRSNVCKKKIQKYIFRNSYLFKFSSEVYQTFSLCFNDNRRKKMKSQYMFSDKQISLKKNYFTLKHLFIRRTLKVR